MEKKKYYNINNLKKLIFPQIAYEKLPLLMIDEDSIKFITFANTAQEITQIIMNSLHDYPNISSEMSTIDLMKQLVITEMTAGVGGNVINFAKYFKYVNAFEIDKLRFEYLENNLKVYDILNVNCYCKNSFDALINENNIQQDIVFFDPPWGGSNYKQFENLRLKFEENEIEDVCLKLCQLKIKIIVLKLPHNYDFEYFKSKLNSYEIDIYALERLTLVIIKSYSNKNP